jgi:predicted RNA binding protein YcfA (HicA-like mRNA interferase family)/predicted RNase H-like HicB family nuclease
MKVRDVIKRVEKDGWVLERTRGSHRQYVHATKPGTITVPGHEGDDMASRYVKLNLEEGRAEMIYAVVFEKAPHNWAAYVPDLPGCVTTGPTLEDSRGLIAEAIEFHIEGMRLHGEPVPEPSTVVDSLEVRAA